MRWPIKTDGYSLSHIRSSYEWKQVRLDVGVENSFDRFYALALGGAHLGQGTTRAINLPVGTQWGTAVPGMGRSVYVEMNVILTANLLCSESAVDSQRPWQN